MQASRSRPAVLITAMASVVLLSALVAALAGSADRIKQSGAGHKRLQMKCPPRFTTACKPAWRLVCVKRDSKGCCTKSVCQFPH